MENVNHCLICGSESFSTFFECSDHFISNEKFKICICDRCSFCFTNPRPELSESFRYYESDKYISHSRTSKGRVNRLYHKVRKLTIRNKKRIAKHYSNNQKILDYGCGTGEFLNSMHLSGFNCIGLEPNENARQYAVSHYGLTVLDEEQLENIDENSLGSITLWHVLEHVYPVKKRLLQFHNKLCPGGTLIVALPNRLSLDAKIYGPFWAAYDVPRHIYHFTPDNVIQLMGNYGFDHIKTRSMIFDAFYISLLSEKYKSAGGNFLKAIINGFRSNLSAISGNGNYSSLIYIFKKSI